MKLKHSQLANLPDGKHPDGAGLYFRVRGNSKSWTFRSMISGKRVEMSVGTFPAVSLSDARSEAVRLKGLISQGIDPRAAKRAASVNHMTVASAIEATFEAKQASLKNGGAAGRWMSPLNVHVIPKIGNIPLASLAVNDVVAVMRPIWTTKPTASEKALQRLGMAVRHAFALGALGVDPNVCTNARIVLGANGHQVKHFRAMSWRDIPAFYANLGDLNSELALKLTILTVSRQKPVRLATVGQFDLDAGIWTVPGVNMKSKKGKAQDFRIPLSPEAIKVVRMAMNFIDIDDPNVLLFPSKNGGTISDMTMAAVLKRATIPVTVHGFRSSFKDWSTEQGHDWVTSELALAHAVGTSVQQAYARTDALKRRSVLMNAWAKHCAPLKLEHHVVAA